MKEELELLKHVYQDSEMSTYTLTELLESLKNKDNKIKNAIEDILKTYEKFQKESSSILEKEHQEAKDKPMLAKMGAKMGIKKEVKCDNSDSAIAKMLIEGISMGSLDTTKKIHDYQDRVGKKVLNFAKSFLAFQEESIEKLKTYL